jgi:MoxR-like ATPase
MSAYKRIFKKEAPLPSTEQKARGTAGDRRDGLVYVYNDKIELAINVALATSRPLLVRGPSGSGKSSLALNVALKLKRRYYEHVVSSVTEARDLLWRFESVRQLSDATSHGGKQYPPNRYLDPGQLWWAIDPESAELRGLDASDPDVPPAKDPAAGVKSGKSAVLLIDEIDKADPDVPNNLLVPLGSLQFGITYPERTITLKEDAEAPFVVITTNEERELPSAFVRRCIVVAFDRPDGAKLIEIAKEHFPDADEALCGRVAGYLDEVGKAKEAKGEAPPSTAEYLDAVSACSKLQSASQMRTAWKEIASVVLDKTASS